MLAHFAFSRNQIFSTVIVGVTDTSVTDAETIVSNVSYLKETR